MGMPGHDYASYGIPFKNCVKFIFSSWLLLNGGMAHGTWLGPLTFVILIDGLRLDCLVHKFVDDTTASEILKRNQTELATW